jgi:hypothetical protein
MSIVYDVHELKKTITISCSFSNENFITLFYRSAFHGCKSRQQL